MKTVLLTGFEPFGGQAVNPALAAIHQLQGTEIAEHRIMTAALPVVRFQAIATLITAIDRHAPAAVIAIGQAGGRPDITVERVAINIDDYRIADNAGNQPLGEPIIPDAPAAYWSTLPIRAIAKELAAGGIPASVSNSAGTFVCNHLFFGLMHYLSVQNNPPRAGFIHIPYLPEQAAALSSQPSMSLATIVAGLQLAVRTTLTVEKDVCFISGTVS